MISSITKLQEYLKILKEQEIQTTSSSLKEKIDETIRATGGISIHNRMLAKLLASLADPFKEKNNSSKESLYPILWKLAYFEMQPEGQKVFVKDHPYTKKKQLGNLIVKARLAHLYPAKSNILYGMLVYCRWALIHKPELLKIWQEMGKD